MPDIDATPISVPSRDNRVKVPYARYTVAISLRWGADMQPTCLGGRANRFPTALSVHLPNLGTCLHSRIFYPNTHTLSMSPCSRRRGLG
jgi:hypothetical protein